MKELNELVEQAKEVAVLHGSVWSSALCEKGGNGQALRHHAIISDEKNDFVIDTGSDTNEASWLCDYLELCSPANILAIAEAFRALEQKKEDAEKVRDNWKQETKIRNSQLDLAVCQRQEWQQRAEAAEEKLAELEKQIAGEGWIKWSGGECPVGAHVRVDTKWSDGDLITCRAGAVIWSWDDCFENITAYRLAR